MTADEQLRFIIGDFVVKLALLMAERDELKAKVAALTKENDVSTPPLSNVERTP